MPRTLLSNTTALMSLLQLLQIFGVCGTSMGESGIRRTLQTSQSQTRICVGGRSESTSWESG
eukprot:1274966-Alexandrium_andersonii.AAC.1